MVLRRGILMVYNLPFGSQFYQGQAQVYDKTRTGLLRGRNTMLAMSAEHLRVIRAERPNERLVWVDVGGGTGESSFRLSSLHVIPNVS